MGAVSSPRRILFVYPEPYFCSGGGIGTYLKHAIRAHLDAGREVHLLTWATGTDGWYHQDFNDYSLEPLNADQVTIIKISESEIANHNSVGVRAKNIADILCSHIKVVETAFQPDLIESTDYAAPLHTYFEERRCALHESAVPVVIFNHGLLSDVWPASALIPSEQSCRELVLEHQVIRWSDLVFAPSEAAAKRIADLRRGDEGVHIVREPYSAQNWTINDSFAADKFIYFGRVSFAKGVDIFAGMLTAIANEWPISAVTFLGRRETFPFRRADAVDYLHARISPDLWNTLHFVDSVPREEVPQIVEQAGFFGNFSRSETFSYTTLEALSSGAVPLLQQNSPMAEMLPPDVRESGAFAEVPHRTETVMRLLAYWRDSYHELMDRCQEYARSLTDPSVYASRYSEVFAALPARPHRKNGPGHYSGADVTVLIATHNDAHLLVEAIDSLDRQTVRVGEILVLDDGSSDASQIAKLDELASQGVMRLLRVKNMGLVAARNYLVEHARTELAIFLDSDDLLEPTYVEKTLHALNSDPGRWSAIMTRRKNFGLNDDEFQSFLLDTPMQWVSNDFRMTALIKRSVLTDIRFDPAIRNGEADDWWWWLTFTIRGYEAALIPEALFRYRTALGSMSVPWTEGQAALTIEAVQRAVADAASKGIDLRPILQNALLTAYRNGRDVEFAQAGLPLPGRGPANFNLATFQKIQRIVIRVLGPTNGAIVSKQLERIVHRSPLMRNYARRVLRVISRLSRRRASGQDVQRTS